jgi:hypothetical protein
MEKRVKVMAAVANVFFTAKVEAMARAANADLVRVSSREEMDARRAEPIQVFVADLEDGRLDPLERLKQARGLWPGAALWAFAAHGSRALIDAARQVESCRVLARGAFEKQFPEFLAGLSGRDGAAPSKGGAGP